MGTTFIFLVLLLAVILWFLLSFMFPVIGRFINRIVKDAYDEMTRDDETKEDDTK